MSKTKYPDGTKFFNWTLMLEKQKGSPEPVIRRWVYFPDGKKKYERMPRKRYKHMLANLAELQNFVIRQNGKNPNKIKAEKATLFRHAYINSDFMDEYFDYLSTQIPSKKHRTTEYNSIKKYFLKFFIDQLNLKDPVTWHINQDKWAKSLLNIESENNPLNDRLRIFKKGERLSAKTLKGLVNAANRFMGFLHMKRPDEVKPLKFRPINQATFKKIEADRELENRVTIRKFVTDADWELIQKTLPANIKYWTLLAYNYGLRRNEAMAVTQIDIRNGFIFVTRQVIGFDQSQNYEYGALKGRATRKVPHWFCTPEDAYNWISSINELDKKMHPNTLTREWRRLMNALKLDYDFHDLRHTYITKAVESHSPVDVQRAAGHVNIQTTSAYIKDSRILDEDRFRPKIKQVIEINSKKSK